MDLEAYLDRIGYQGPVQPDEQALFALHRAHLAAIPYENLDIQLGQPKVLDEDRCAERLVGRRRGGWCYEMNGLFFAALREIGFDVQRVGGAVVRDILGEDAIGNHMVLLVDLDRRFVADVGLGDGPLHPFPLEERRWSEDDFHYGLARTDDGWWRFENHEHGLAPRFDFTETPRALDWYQPQCRVLQSGDSSPFVALAMTFRRDPRKIRALRDVTYLEIEGTKKTETRIESRGEYARLLGQLLDLDLGEDALRLWSIVSARDAKRRAEAAGQEVANLQRINTEDPKDGEDRNEG